MMILLCFGCWLLSEMLRREPREDGEGAGAVYLFPSKPVASLRGLAMGLWRLLMHLVRSSCGLDWAVLFFLIVSFWSLFVSENFGVSFYELRNVAGGPVLFYLLLREVSLEKEGL